MEWTQCFSAPFVFLPLSGLVVAQGYRGNVSFLLRVIGGGLTAFPWVPPSLFNGATGVVHSLAIWPQP